MGTEVIQITRFTKLLLGAIGGAILAAGGGFLQWANVVDNTRNDVAQAAADVRDRIGRLEAKIDTYAGLLKAHEAQPWHEQAGTELRRLRGDVRQTLDRVKDGKEN